MKIKRILALIIAMVMLFSLTACNNNKDDETTTERTSLLFDEDILATEDDTSTSDETPTSTTTTTAPTTTKPASNPSQWSKSKIVDEYKRAAKNSSSVTSKQVMTLSEISVNNGDGALNGMLQLVKPIITQVLSNNSNEFAGITGGHQNLVESDVYAARAYASGDNTVIEMILVEQTDGAHGDMYSGTVGHAISVVGDVSAVTKQFADLGLTVEIPDDNISMTYTNPRLKVLIDSNGKIVNGTWSYVVDLDLSSFKVGNVAVDKADALIDFVVTVNGGFSE